MATSLDKAYLIGGHGSEGRGTFILPPGCIIVVKSITGYATSFHANYRSIFQLSPNILKDPIANYALLHKTFGSLAIYMPGDTCPDFSYELVLYDPQLKEISSYGSGLIDTDLVHADNNFKRKMASFRVMDNYNNYTKLIKQSNITKTQEYVEQRFKHSVYPTPNRVHNDLKTLEGLGKTGLHDIIDVLRREYATNQSALCEKFKSDKFNSVFYNLSCRVTPFGRKLDLVMPPHIQYNQIPNELQGLYPPKNRLSVFRNMTPLNQNMTRKRAILDAYHGEMPLSRYRNPHKSAQNLHKQSTNMIKQHIGEAEKHRKPHIRSLYASTSSKGGKNSVKKTRKKKETRQ